MLPTRSVVSITPIAVFPSGELRRLRVAVLELPPFLFTTTRTNTIFSLITVVPDEIIFVNSFADDSNGFIGYGNEILALGLALADGDSDPDGLRDLLTDLDSLPDGL